MLTLTLPSTGKTITAGDQEVLVVTNADLRESANVECWPVQNKFEDKLALASRFSRKAKRAHLYKGDQGHGFISSQREGSDLFATLDPDAPVIVLLTAWQYSHHLAPSLARHRGPVLLLANFDGLMVVASSPDSEMYLKWSRRLPRWCSTLCATAPTKPITSAASPICRRASTVSRDSAWR